MSNKDRAVTSGLGVPLLVALVCVGLIGSESVSVRALTVPVGTTHVVDDDGVQCPTATFTTIVAAVAAAAPSGDTIQVCAGTYAENVVLGKSVMLLGAQSGVDARGRTAVPESIIAPATLTGLTLTAGSAGATVDGFTFQGAARGIESASGPINDLQIKNNRFQGFTGNAIFLNDSGSDVTVDRNRVDGSSKTGGGALVHLDTDAFHGFWLTNNEVVNGATATGFFVDGNHNVGESATRKPKVVGNLVMGNQTGMNLGTRAFGKQNLPLLLGGTFAGEIHNNTFRGNTFDGLQGGFQRVEVKGNVFRSNGRSGIALTSFGNTGLDRGAQNSVVTCNLIIGNGFLNAGSGVSLSATQAAGTMATNVLDKNSFGNNANLVGMTHNGSEAVVATSNWWGDPTGPTIATNPGGIGQVLVNASGSVIYSPFLFAPDVCAPPSPPGAPTIGSATASHLKVHVAFTPPVDPGGAPITGYTATCLGGYTASGPSSPISVTVPNGAPLTCTVHATNTAGDSDESAPSNSVTPAPVVCPAVVNGGSVIEAVVGVGSSAADWLTWAKSSDPVTSYAPGGQGVGWKYVPLPRPKTVTLTAPTLAGSYQFRLFADNTYSLINTCPFTVVGAPALSISDVTVTEGNGGPGTTSATFTVTMSPTSGSTVAVNYATADGTATAGGDYTATSGQLTFLTGQSSKTITVPVNGDMTVEGNETFFVNLSVPVGASIQDAQGQGTISDDDTLACPVSAPAGVNFSSTVFGGASATDWLTWAKPSDPVTSYASGGQGVGWNYVPLPRSQVVTLKAPTVPGQYQLRLLANNTFNVIGTCLFPVP